MQLLYPMADEVAQSGHVLEDIGQSPQTRGPDFWCPVHGLYLTRPLHQVATCGLFQKQKAHPQHVSGQRKIGHSRECPKHGMVLSLPHLIGSEPISVYALKHGNSRLGGIWHRDVSDPGAATELASLALTRDSGH